MLRTCRAAAVVLALGLAGCASSGGATPRNDSPLCGAEVSDYTNVRLALETLRPSWVRRAREVFIDNELAGPVEILRSSFNERINRIELIPSREVIRRLGPCQAPAGTGTMGTPRDPQCGTRPVIHVVLFSGR